MGWRIPRLRPEQVVIGSTVLLVGTADVNLSRPSDGGRMVEVWQERSIGSMRPVIIRGTRGRQVQIELHDRWTAWVDLDRLATADNPTFRTPAPRTVKERLLSMPFRYAWTKAELARIAARLAREKGQDARRSPFDETLKRDLGNAEQLAELVNETPAVDQERLDHLADRFTCLIGRCRHSVRPDSCDTRWPAVGAGPARWELTASDLVNANDLR